jgi:hypothetical protein
MFTAEENSRVVFKCPEHNSKAADIDKLVLVPFGFEKEKNISEGGCEDSNF